MLTRQAIDQSSEIIAIEEQLALTAQRQDYAQSRRWVNYLTLDPLRLVQNVLGGGDVQRDRIAIASLELETANLIRQREEQAQDVANEVVSLMLSYEKLVREGELIASQLQSHRTQVSVMESAYRTGQGSTAAMIALRQRTEQLEARCQESAIGQSQDVRALEILTGETLPEGSFSAVGDDCRHTTVISPIPQGGWDGGSVNTWRMLSAPYPNLVAAPVRLGQ